MFDSTSAVKTGSIILNFVIMFGCGVLPLTSEKFRNSPKLIGYANSFAGGLFLSIGVLHLLGEGTESFDAYFDSKGLEDEEHWPNIVMVAAFTLFLIIDKVVLSKFQQLQESNSDIETGRGLLNNESPEKEEIVSERVKQKNNNLTPHILNLAIGIHSIFEGIAIGLTITTKNALALSLAVLCHKWAAGLALGTSYFKSSVDTSLAKQLIFIQAFMTPIGIGIGWGFSVSGNLVRGIFQCLAGGTFLYVGTIEIIPMEFLGKGDKWIKLVFFVLAVILVSILPIIESMA